MNFLKHFKKQVADPNDIEFANLKRPHFMNRSLFAEFAKAGAPVSHGKTNGLTTNSFIPFLLNREQMREAALIDRILILCQCPEWVNYTDYQWMFTRHPLAFNICTTYPRYSWNPRPIVLEMDNDSNVPTSEFEKACAAIADKVDLFGAFERVDIGAQIGQYAVLYVDFNDDAEGAKDVPEDAVMEYDKTFKNPITDQAYKQAPQYMGGLGKVNWKAIKGKGADAINYVVVYQQANAWPTQYVADESRPCYSLVSYYNLQSGGQVFGANGQTNNIVYGAALPVTWNVVHSSRCVHVADRKISNNILGVPALQPIFNSLLCAMRVEYGSAMVFQNNARGGLAINIDQKENQSIDEADMTAFHQQVESYLSGYSRTLVFDGMEAKTLNFEVADPEKHMGVYIQNISAGCGIPTRILMGNEAGRLASTQDKINFDSRVKTRQEGYCSGLIRQFFDPLIANGVIPLPKSGTYKVHFPLLDISDDTQNAANFNQVTLGLAALANAQSPEIENEMDAFTNKAKEILKVKGSNIDITITDRSYLHPDTSSEDLYNLRGGKDAIQAI